MFLVPFLNFKKGTDFQGRPQHIRSTGIRRRGRKKRIRSVPHDRGDARRSAREDCRGIQRQVPGVDGAVTTTAFVMEADRFVRQAGPTEEKERN